MKNSHPFDHQEADAKAAPPYAQCPLHQHLQNQKFYSTQQHPKQQECHMLETQSLLQLRVM